MNQNKKNSRLLLNTSKYEYHTSCPQCGSRDNLAMYSDGHGWCFGCQEVVIKPESYTKYSRRQDRYNDPTAENQTLRLPNDFTTDIPELGLTWLRKYTLSPNEIVRNRIGWSQNGWTLNPRKAQASKTSTPILYSPLMIFPVFDQWENLLMFQARYMGPEQGLPKYWTKGVKDCLHILEVRGDNTNTIVLVEDLISAIKTSRTTTSMPLWGSDIKDELAVRLCNIYDNVVIWLDKDKATYARKRAESLRFLFKTVKVVISDGDPKDYETNSIRQYLGVGT